MKRIFIPGRLLPAMLLGLRAFAQEAPDLSKIADKGTKVDAWIAWCETLRLNQQTGKPSFVLLGQAADKGLALVPADDAAHRAKFFTYAALSQYYKHRFDSAEYYFYRSRAEGEKARSGPLVAKACTSLIPVTFQLGEIDKTEDCRRVLQSIADTARDASLLLDVNHGLGSYYQYKSYYNTAQDYFIRNLQLREKTIDTTSDLRRKFDYAIECDMLSKLYLNTQMVDKSLNTLRQAQRFSDVSQNVSNRLLSSFVEAFTTSGRIDSALWYDAQLEKDTANYRNFPSEVVSSELNIGLYYMDHAQYSQAEPYLARGAQVAALIGNPILNFQVQMAQGRYYEETKQYDRSIPLLAAALPIAKMFNMELYANTLKYMALAQKGKGNTAAALGYFEEYGRQNDSLTREKLNNNFADQETRYETTQKEERIHSLNRENRLQVLELQAASRQRQLMIVGLAALGVIALLLYFIYRNREKLNAALNRKNAELGELNSQLAVANDTKARLFGIIGHDLRAPISRIVQLLQIQKDRPGLLTAEDRGQHETQLKSASQNLLETMEDMLLWSKSQMANFKPHFTPVSLPALLQREADFLAPLAEERGTFLALDLAPAIVWTTDENFLGIIARNLIQNAIKYNAGGPIRIHADERQLTVTNRSATPAERLNAILENQVVDSNRSGLGLQLSTDLAAAIGKNIRFVQTGEDITAVVG